MKIKKRYSATLIHTEDGARIEGHIPLHGISIKLDPENESPGFLFYQAGNLLFFKLEILKHRKDKTINHLRH